jgi:hypothetical protein
MTGKKIYLGGARFQGETATWHRTMLGLLIGVMIMVLVTMLSGCSNQCCDEKYKSAECVYYYEPTISPKMILRSKKDPPVDPQIFAYRSDWPSTEGDVDFARITTYREYWYNRQSGSGNIPDYTYRQVQSYRTGVSIK